MKRAIFMTMLAVSLTFGAVGAWAFPNNPCDPTGGDTATSRAYPKGPCVSQGRLFLLLLPTFVAPIG